MDLSSVNLKLFKKSRRITYFLAVVLLALTIVFSVTNGALDGFKLANYAGFLSFTFLCLALAVTPFRKLFPIFPLNSSLVYARRAIGVSAFGFAAVHFLAQFVFTFQASFDSFFSAVQLSGLGIPTGSFSFFILFLLALTSTDYAVKALGKTWFVLHKAVYLAYP